MDHRYFIQLSFKGTNFNGWQKQVNAPSVQASIEKALSVLLKLPIEIVGAGRTDSGVHARYYIAHFDSPNIIDDEINFVYHLNKILSFDIAVQSIFKVKNQSHARFDAIARSYEYQYTLKKDPFETETSVLLKTIPDIGLLNAACMVLTEFSDFTSFCKLHSDNKTNLCKIIEANWRFEGNLLIFRISADRFLRNMVRAIVGTLLQVGYGKISIQEFKDIIEFRNRSKAGTSAPAHGLYLIDIEYPEDI
jgi:tRNA pseudouridine38-40 synthase